MSESSAHNIINSIDFKASSVFLDDFLLLKGKLSGRLVVDAKAVLDSWVKEKKKCADNNKEYGWGYNPLARIPIKEPVHSRIIGDFLNRHGSHGQGALFLQCFLNLIGIPDPDQGDWQISVETGRVDILLWRESPASMIIIENKVKDAVDQPNQIYRYWHHQMYLWKVNLWNVERCLDEQTKRSFRLIYMPADGSKQPADHSLQRPKEWSEEVNKHPVVPLECKPISLREVMKRWREVLIQNDNVPKTNHRLRVFFDLYEEIWK